MHKNVAHPLLALFPTTGYAFKGEETMLCRKIMSQDVQWVGPSDSAAYAARVMAFHNLGFLPVCSKDGKPLGVLTDRDIALRVVGEDRPISQTLVAEIMTFPLHSVPADFSLEEAGEVMTKEGISRLLVLDENGFLLGILGIGDLIVRGPGRVSLKIAHGVYAREIPIKSSGQPRLAEPPNPEFFRGRRDSFSGQSPDSQQNTARLEAESVIRGGVNDLKEFPS
jgi:CBS domain-containing protein